MRNYFSLVNMTAGFVAVMVGFTSSVVLVFQAAMQTGANQAEISSWLFALGLSISLSCIVLSLYYKIPILIGWSTPGAALLATSLAGIPLSEAAGAFVFAALLTLITGMTGWFEKIISYIPKSLSSAMLAGILLSFGMNIFVAMQHQGLLVGIMFLTYLIGKRFFPRSVIILVLVVGACVAKMEGLCHLMNFHFSLTSPIFTPPVFTFSTLLSVGIPLFVVTMTSQNIPGIAVLNSAGYSPPISPVISFTGLSNLIFAPFGAYSIGLTALTAAICASKEADINPQNRFKSTIFAGLCWLTIGVFGSTIVALFLGFPKELIVAIAGLALLGSLAGSLKNALEEESQREPALITILLSASGISIFGVSSAFWGLLAGIFSSLILNGFKNEIVNLAVAELDSADKTQDAG